MNRGKLTKITAVFFVFMLCFTALSRAADQVSIAVVQTQKPQNMMIAHSVKATGKIVQNQELAVTTEPDQRVTAIHVSEGQRVSKGDLLFELDTTLLEEKILYQQQEMEKQKLTVEDAKSQKDVSAQQKANEQAQAAEQYSLSTRSAGVQVSRAKEQLSEAKKALKEFQQKGGLTQEESSVEASLEQALADKAEAYIQAQQELTSLQWRIENAVNTAQQNARSGASLTPNSTVRTQSSEEIIDEGVGDTDVGQTIEPVALYSDSGMDTLVPEITIDGIEAGDGPDIMIPENPTGDGDFGSLPEGSVPTPITEGGPIPAAGSMENNAVSTENADSSTGTDILGIDMGSIAENTPVTQEELNRIEQSVRDSYSQELQAAQKKVEDAQADRDSAEAALLQYQQERAAIGNEKNEEAAKQLIANVKAAQQAYEDASIAANEAAVTSGRAVAAAGIPNASNNSDRMYEISYEQMELSLKKLEELKKNSGKVYASADGLIMKINIQTGEKTADTTAVLMADLAKGYRFTADITKEQEKYIGTGDLVTLSGGNGKLKLEELPVESVTADEEDESIYHVTVQVPEDTFEIGMTAAMDFTKKSEAYPVTVPLSALHLDEKNQPYVLVPEEFESIMGTEVKARKVGVTVQEQNESYAALAEGPLGSSQEVITGSDKAVDDGSRVRIEG
ncbi:MAG: biotin/lipoyl-binding protein [Lachnospiraceae bacterium]|nr:biotin/lipoyl-binding protein [Lachnospiraceae bacterium]